jgi:DNA-binding NarL/FixJ family response regulator
VIQSKPFITLLVEDNDVFREVIKETLESQFIRMEIIEARDGPETLQQVETFQPNLIFMDINLPGENGLKLTEKIKTKYPDMMVCILTSYDTLEYREAAGRAKASYFLNKGSFTKETIVNVVESVLNTLNKPTPFPLIH